VIEGFAEAGAATAPARLSLAVAGGFRSVSIAGAQTKPADTGDYGVNSVPANALRTAELFALFARIGETPVVDPAHGISSEEAVWADGDTRAVLNSKQTAFQYFLNRVWQTMARFGIQGVEASQVFSPDMCPLQTDSGRIAGGWPLPFVPFVRILKARKKIHRRLSQRQSF
jgi:hypothetical protein